MQRLQIRVHHIRHAAYFRRFPKVIHGCLLLPVRLSQCFKCYIHSDLVPEFKTVRHGFGGAEDPDHAPADLLFLCPKAKRISRETDDSDRRRADSRCPGLSVDCEPNLMRRLSSDFMKPEGREQADNRLRELAAHFQEADVL